MTPCCTAQSLVARAGVHKRSGGLLSWGIWDCRGQLITQTPHMKVTNMKQYERTERCVSFVCKLLFLLIWREHERHLETDKSNIKTQCSLAAAGVCSLTWSVRAPGVCFLSCSYSSQMEPQRTVMKKKRKGRIKMKGSGNRATRGMPCLHLHMLSSLVSEGSEIQLKWQTPFMELW